MKIGQWRRVFLAWVLMVFVMLSAAAAWAAEGEPPPTTTETIATSPPTVEATLVRKPHGHEKPWHRERDDDRREHRRPAPRVVPTPPAPRVRRAPARPRATTIPPTTTPPTTAERLDHRPPSFPPGWVSTYTTAPRSTTSTTARPFKPVVYHEGGSIEGGEWWPLVGCAAVFVGAVLALLVIWWQGRPYRID